MGVPSSVSRVLADGRFFNSPIFLQWLPSNAVLHPGPPSNPHFHHPSNTLTAGHNKWSKVKHIKAHAAVINGKVSSKCAHEIARTGGGDPSMNAQLNPTLDNAKTASMPNKIIDHAI